MKFIYYVLAISTVLAFKDYFKNIQDLQKYLKYTEHYTENWEPKNNQTVTDEDCIQVISVAVHGDKIEPRSDELAKRLYESLRQMSDYSKSMLYTFESKINSIESGKFTSTTGCKTVNCCEVVEGIKLPPGTFNSTLCTEIFKKNVVEKCKIDQVCHQNAAHITSEIFSSDNLTNILTPRYPVSFHGYLDKNDADNKPVSIVLGGLSKQKHELAAELYDGYNNIQVAICISGSDCKVFKPNTKWSERVNFEGKHLAGTSTKNFVNEGIQNCGLQIEMSNTYRKYNDENNKSWNYLVKSIIKTLPKKNDKNLCDKSN